MISKKQAMTLEILAVLLMLIAPISALSFGGISKDGIEAYPGETVRATLSIQNMQDDSVNVIMKGTIEQGSDIVSFAESPTIEIPAKSIIKIPININVPADTPIGTRYPITIKFSTVEGETTEEQGATAFVMNLKKEFEVVVKEKPSDFEPVKEGTPVWVWLVVAIIVITIIILIILKRKSTISATNAALTQKASQKDQTGRKEKK